jgi:AraC-like DNA-binding protein
MSRRAQPVGVGWVRAATLASRRRLYLLARVLVARHYRRELTLAAVAAALSSSPRQLQRAYAQFGELSFSEDLHNRRMAAAAELLLAQRSIPVSAVARLVGYRRGPHFAQAFRRRFGLSPARFRDRAPLAGGVAYRAAGGTGESGDPAAIGSRSASSSPVSIGSARGSLRRISVPPPGADSAVTVPPC